MHYETMFSFDLSTPEDEKDVKSLGQGISLGIALSIKYLLFLLMLSKPGECISCSCGYRIECRIMGFSSLWINKFYLHLVIFNYPHTEFNVMFQKDDHCSGALTELFASFHPSRSLAAACCYHCSLPACRFFLSSNKQGLFFFSVNVT